MAGLMCNSVMCRQQTHGGLPFIMENKRSQEKLLHSFPFSPFPGRNAEIPPEGGTVTLNGHDVKATNLKKSRKKAQQLGRTAFFSSSSDELLDEV